MMCGDGTNDVGALKAAHVGISIINDADFENKVLSQTTSTTKKGSQSSDPNDRLVRALAEIQEQEMDPTLVKLGDASIASPFTSRRTSIDAVLVSKFRIPSNTKFH
jgi:cation-transporting ATPase 13A1